MLRGWTMTRMMRMDDMVTLNEGEYDKHNNSMANMCITRMSDSMARTCMMRMNSITNMMRTNQMNDSIASTCMTRTSDSVMSTLCGENGHDKNKQYGTAKMGTPQMKERPSKQQARGYLHSKDNV